MDGLLRGVAPPAREDVAQRHDGFTERGAVLVPRGSRLAVVVERNHTAPAAKSSGASNRSEAEFASASQVGSLVLSRGVSAPGLPRRASRRCARTRPARRGPACLRRRAPGRRNFSDPTAPTSAPLGDAGCCWRSTVGDAVCWRGGTASSTKGAKGAGMGGLARASLERSITAARALLPGACWRNCFFRQPRVDDRPRAAACRSQKAATARARRPSSGSTTPASVVRCPRSGEPSPRAAIARSAKIVGVPRWCRSAKGHCHLLSCPVHGAQRPVCQ